MPKRGPIKRPYWRSYANMSFANAGAYGRRIHGQNFDEVERNNKNTDIAVLAQEKILEAMSIAGIGDDKNALLLDEIFLIADLYREHDAVHRDQPRLGDIRETLTCIAEKARSLNNALTSIDQLSLKSLSDERFFELHSLFDGVFIDPNENIHRPVQYINLSKDHDGLLYGNGSAVTDILKNLERAAKNGAEGVGVDDGGARKNWPAKELVCDCILFWQSHCPSKISSTATGSFRAFVSYVFELATGQEGVQLETDIREHVAWFKEDEKWRSSEGGIRAEISYFEDQIRKIEILLDGSPIIGPGWTTPSKEDRIIFQEKIENLRNEINRLIGFPEITP